MGVIAEQAARLPDRYVRALAPALADARAELRQDLERWLTQIPDGELRFTAQRYRQALLQLEHTLEVVEKRLPIEVEGTLRAQGRAAGAMAIAHLEEEVAVFAAVFGHSVRPLQLAEAAILAEGSTQLIPRYRASAARYGKAMSTDIRRMLATGVVRGETFEELTRRLVKHGGPRGLVSLRGVIGEPGAIAENISEGLFRRYNHWAERIVRTEGLHAYNVQHQTALEEADRQDPGYSKRWDAAADRRLCELCAELDGKVVELDGVFVRDRQGRDIPHPPRHPNCFPAGTLVRTPSGDRPIETIAVGDLVLTHRGRWRRVLALSRQVATGHLVTLHRGGDVLRATPNHPIATPRGWIAAEELDPRGAEVWVLERVVLETDDAPASRKERSFLASILSRLPRRGVPLTPVDLDSDAIGGDGEVYKEHVHLVADSELNPEASQGDRHGGLVVRLRAAGLRGHHAAANLWRLLRSAHRVVRWRGLSLALGSAHAGVSASIVLRDARRSMGAVVAGHRYRLLSVRVGRKPFVGPVYNFQVDEDESYIANGFIVHNCRCALTPWRPEWDEEPKSPAEPEPALDANARLDQAEEELRAAEEAARRARGRHIPGDPYLTPEEIDARERAVEPARERARAARRELSEQERLERVLAPLEQGDFHAAVNELRGNMALELGEPSKPIKKVEVGYAGLGVLGRLTPDGVMTLEQGQAEELRAFAAAARAGRMADVRRNLQGFSTFVHETTHSFGPGKWRSFEGLGLITEELATEATSHQLMRRMGVPGDWLDSHIAYAEFFSPQVSWVEALYEVEGAEAWRIVRERALAYKQLGLAIDDEFEAAAEWIRGFPPTGNPVLDEPGAARGIGGARVSRREAELLQALVDAKRGRP